MKKFIQNIKNELSCWKPFEIGFLAFFLMFIFLNALVVKDNPIAVISALFGILYTVFAGKGKVSCFFFGLLGSGCYSFISFKSALWGQLLLYMCYYIPMEILGIFQWKKNLKQSSDEIIKTKLSSSDALKLSLYTAFALIVAIVFLYKTGDSSPIIDAITTILSIVGMFLTVKRCIEQWIVWIIVNGLSALMWANLVFLHGVKAYSTVLMWSVYFVVAFYFFFSWKKEVKF